MLGDLDINTKVLNKRRVDGIESELAALKGKLSRFESGEDVDGLDLDEIGMSIETLMEQLSKEQRKQKLIELRKLIDSLAV